MVSELPLSGWAEAPELKLSIQLSRAQMDAKSDANAAVANLGKAAQPTARQAAPTADEITVTTAELLMLPSLTRAEQVIVKDSWNKLLAFRIY